MRKVSAKGKARFKWVEGAGAGNWWDETFAYVLDFDEEGKVTDYQVWSDSGAAYLASKGQLNQLREVSSCLSADGPQGSLYTPRNSRPKKSRNKVAIVIQSCVRKCCNDINELRSVPLFS